MFALLHAHRQSAWLSPGTAHRKRETEDGRRHPHLSDRSELKRSERRLTTTTFQMLLVRLRARFHQSNTSKIFLIKTYQSTFHITFSKTQHTTKTTTSTTTSNSQHPMSNARQLGSYFIIGANGRTRSPIPRFPFFTFPAATVSVVWLPLRLDNRKIWLSEPAHYATQPHRRHRAKREWERERERERRRETGTKPDLIKLHHASVARLYLSGQLYVSPYIHISHVCVRDYASIYPYQYFYTFGKVLFWWRWQRKLGKHRQHWLSLSEMFM